MSNETTTTLGIIMEQLPKAVRQSLGRGALHRLSALKSIRKKMVTEALDVAEVDVEIDLLSGTKENPGLLDALGVSEEDKEPAKDPDPVGEQRSVLDERDYRTHDLTADGVRELVAKIIADNEAPAAVRQLNALEDGEREREPKPRDNVLQVIRSARSPLVKRVKILNGGE